MRDLGDHIVKGGEHDVYWSVDRGRVHKVTYPGEFGFIIDEVSLLSDRTFQNETKLQIRPALPSEYLIRWALLDRIFGVQTEFRGVYENEGSEPSLVISQQFIGAHPGEIPEWQELEAFMSAFGFAKVDPRLIRTPEIADHTWYRNADGIIVTDAFPRNFRIDVTGAVMPVDLIVNIVPPGASKLLATAAKPFKFPT
jgi:hypothetical protein